MPCANCGKERQPGHRFCWYCGALLDAQRELKQVTVLLADLCDSTEQVLASGLEDGQAYLESAYRIMAEAVARFGGTRVQWRGDELLALFGAPVAQEDHAANACRAALRILEQVAAHSTEATPMAVRIGIVSGEVIVGPGAGDLAARYSADGMPIHLASRLERLALPGTALMSASTHRLAEYRVDTLPLGKRSVRSFKDPVEVFQLLAECRTAPSASLARRRHLAPLVGRDAIVAELTAAGNRAFRTGLRAIGIRGDAGVGKTRLIEELCVKLEGTGAIVAAASARNYSSDLPFGLAADVVRALLHRMPAGHALNPALADLVERGDPGKAWHSLTPVQRRSQITSAIADLVTELTQSGPLVMVVDDVFLADSESLRLLESLSRFVAGRPVLLLMTYRSEFVHRWNDVPWFTERALPPLAPDEMRDLAGAVLGTNASLEAARHALLERADGNPFFFEQLALMLVDQGSLVGQPGAYHLLNQEAELGVPASVMAAVAARVDRLAPMAKLMLEAGAVTGEPLQPPLIAQMLKVEPTLMAAHIREAVSGALLAPVALGSSAQADDCVFRHALVRETIYKGLTRARRAELHLAAFRALRLRHTDALAESSAVLAMHAYLGGAWAESAEFSLKAMARSIARSANRDALRVFERGIDAAGRISSDKDRQAHELGLRMEALGAMMAMGQFDAIVANLERASDIARQLGDTRRHAAVSLQLAVTLWTRGSYHPALDAAHTASEAAHSAGSRSLQMAALQARMMIDHGLGRYAQATEVAARIQRDYSPELEARRLLPGWAIVAIVNLHAFRADLAASRGDFADAQQMLDAAYGELAKQDHAFSRVLVDFVQAGVLLMQGRAEQASGVLLIAKDLCRTRDVPTMLPPILARLAGALALSGKVQQALDLIEPAIEQKSMQVGGRYNDFYFPYYYAVVLHTAGRIEEAAQSALEAVSVAVELEQAAHVAQARYLAAVLAAKLGRSEVEQVQIDGALLLAMQCPMPWLARQLDEVRGATARRDVH